MTGGRSSGRLSGIGMTSQRTRLRMVERLRAKGIRDEAVLAVMGELPRHAFVDEALASRAYEDMSLPLGFGQTISSPHTVARMSKSKDIFPPPARAKKLAAFVLLNPMRGPMWRESKPAPSEKTLPG